MSLKRRFVKLEICGCVYEKLERLIETGHAIESNIFPDGL